MRTKRLLLSMVFLAACKPPTPAERMETILSWIGTAEMAGEAWLRHATPDTYTRQTLELSNKILSQISSDLLDSPPPSIDMGAFDSVLTGSRRKIERMAGLIKAKDAPQFDRILDSLRTDQKTVQALARNIESKQ